MKSKLLENLSQTLKTFQNPRTLEISLFSHDLSQSSDATRRKWFIPDPMLQILQMLTSDREAERAERQANLTTLQQIAQLAHNNQGHGNQDNHGSKLKNFQNTNPPVFTKSEETLDADDWLQTMENNLEVAGVEANE